MTSEKQTKLTRKTVNLDFLMIADADGTFPYRLVGSYEYGRSLNSLGQLVSTATTEELDVYDKLIGANPEYSFYSGIASNLGINAKLDSLDTSTKDEMDFKYLRHSLAWMMALARSEIGATISMYGKGDDPFGAAVAIGGIGFGSEEFLNLLVDDLAAHLKAAQLDPGYQAALDPKEKVDEKSLAYLRRTLLINDLLTKVMSSGNPKIVMLAKPYVKPTESYAEEIVRKIAIATARVSVTKSELSTERTTRRERLSYTKNGIKTIYQQPTPTKSPLQ